MTDDSDLDEKVESLVREIMRQDLVEVMAGLSPRERDVLRLRNGLDDGRRRTVEEIAGLYGVSAKRVEKIEKGALEKLRCPPQPPNRPARAAGRPKAPFFGDYSGNKQSV